MFANATENADADTNANATENADANSLGINSKFIKINNGDANGAHMCQNCPLFIQQRKTELPHDAQLIYIECIKKIAIEFFNYYGLEINRMQTYETFLQKEQNITYTILYAEKIWTKIKSLKILDTDYNKKTDDEKINEFKKNEETFYKDFPIVARYMVCLDTYNRHAYKKFLLKLIKNNEIIQEAGAQGKSKEGESEEKWIELQADYVKYLYQERAKGKHLNNAELKYVWNQTRDLLKKEFGDFRDLYDKKIKEINEEKKRHSADVAKDLVGRLTTIQSLSESDEVKILEEVKDTIYLQRSKKNIKNLLSQVKLLSHKLLRFVPHVLDAKGTCADAIKEWERDAKMKESKQKMNPDIPIKNKIKNHYDSIEDQGTRFVEEVKNLVYLENYRNILFQLREKLRVRPHYAKSHVISGIGTNLANGLKWRDEENDWAEYVKKNGIVDRKIHVPYSRNLLKMYYDNDERFYIC